MRRFFPFAALLGVAFVFACQDVGTGPDGLVPQFRKGGGKGKPPSGVVPDTLTLTGGMATGDVDLPVSWEGGNDAQNDDFMQAIVMNFWKNEADNKSYGIGDCTVIRGTDGVTHIDDIEEVYATLLLAELRKTVENGEFYMHIDLTGLEIGDTATGPHWVGVWYDNAFGKRTRIVLGNRDGSTVKWVSEGEFVFGGPVTVGIQGVAGKGRKGNRTIACGGEDDNMVVATVTSGA